MNKNKYKHKLLASLGIAMLTGSATLDAQTAYDWTMNEDAAHFGSGSVGSSTGGSYTRSHVTWSGSSMGTGASYNGTNEGPYDGRSGVVRSYRSTGISTRTDASSIFNLSTVGSSATIRTVYHALGSQNDSGGGGHIYQFGLTNNSSYIGASGDESLILAADFKGYNQGTDIVTTDLAIFDHTGVDTTGNGVWSPTSIVNVASGLTIDRLFTGTGNSHAIELKYTNLGSGQIRMDVGVMNLDINGRLVSNVVTGSNLLVQQSHVINHNFSNLNALRPAFGLALNDSFIPMSGANFDWEAAYPTGFATQVPEPSTSMLGILGLGGMIFLRRRK